MAKHSHGSMDTKTQEKTFESFLNLVKWSTVVIIAGLIFLALVNG